VKTPIPNPVFVLLALAGAAAADLPRTLPAGWAAGLVNNSPFTSRPAVEPPSRRNPLEGYCLLGVSPIGNDAYRVTLVHKDKPAERIMVDTNKPNGGFTPLEIISKAGDPLGTVVRLQLDTHVADVGFDEKLLVLATKAAPPAKAANVLAPRARSRVLPPPAKQPSS
jgi:hypothetical protein